jgi:hypothetical protein
LGDLPVVLICRSPGQDFTCARGDFEDQADRSWQVVVVWAKCWDAVELTSALWFCGIDHLAAIAEWM